MFDKIKRDFLLLNMGIISILMLFVCFFIYLSMRFNVYSQISDEMVQIEQDYNSYYALSHISGLISGDEFEQKYKNKKMFIVDLNSNEDVTYYIRFNFDDLATMSQISVECLESGMDKGYIKADGRYYYFSKIFFKNNIQRLLVLDVTDRMLVLQELLVNIMLIGGVSLFVIFIISNFFTNKSVAPIEEAFKKQKNFISDASHELKTPLAVVKTNLEVLMDSDNLTREDRKWLKIANDEINQMSKMINEFLYLAKMENKSELMVDSIVDFSSIVNGVLLSLEAIAFEKHVVFEEKIQDDVFVKGGHDELKRLIIILVDNAIKYCNPGGQVYVSLIAHGNNGSFIIKNTGTVIDLNDRNIIFERFYRANKERERGSQSYGIGLSIAKGTCEKHGFTIKAYPEVDKTCFKVSFKTTHK